MIGTARHATPEQLLDSLLSGAKESSMRHYFGCFSENGYFLGTDATERWSVTQFMDFAEPFFASGDGWVYSLVAGTRHITYFPSKEAPDFCTFDEMLDSKEFSKARSTGSLVYDKKNNCWLVAQVHLTFPIPNDLAHTVCNLVKKFSASDAESSAEKAAADLLADLEKELEETTIDKNNMGPKKKKTGKKKK